MIFLIDDDIKFDKYTFLYFYATWMPFQKRMISMIERAEQKYNIEFLAIDCEFLKNLCKRFKITSVPQMVIFKDGKEIKRMSGVLMSSAFKNILSTILKNKEEQ